MSAEGGINKEKCDWCDGTGLLTAYHRDYRGRMTVIEEHADPRGEIRIRRVPGTLAAHCDCHLGQWMHRTTDEKIRHRIPTMSQLIRGSGRYLLERPDFDDEQPLTDEAKAFVRHWKDNFGGRMLQGVPMGHKCQPEDVGRALHERRERIEAASVDGVVVTGGSAS